MANPKKKQQSTNTFFAIISCCVHINSATTSLLIPPWPLLNRDFDWIAGKHSLVDISREVETQKQGFESTCDAIESIKWIAILSPYLFGGKNSSEKPQPGDNEDIDQGLGHTRDDRSDLSRDSVINFSHRRPIMQFSQFNIRFYFSNVCTFPLFLCLFS